MTTAQYVHWYESLSNPSLSQESNKNLMALEQSEVAFTIARELIISGEYRVHGCQLLSKKLCRPYTF